MSIFHAIVYFIMFHSTVSGTGNYHKVSTFFIDRTKIKCEYDNLPIFWHQPDKDGNRLKLASWLTEHGVLITHTSVSTQCSPNKK
jgi:hypothetical protein